MERIAILHFTAPPAVGGIESLIDIQRAILLDLGHDVTLLVGAGDDPPRGGITRLAELRPDHPRIVEARAELSGTIPAPNHPIVQELRVRLLAALRDHTQCWVHNAFTLYLNPFLSVALAQLAHEEDMGWVAWCADLSEASTYWPSLSPAERRRVTVPPGRIRYVTISQARRAELMRLRSVAESAVRVIPPPLDALEWLGFGPTVRSIVTRLRLDNADPLVLVPAKLLPHKNLGLAVRLAAYLRERRMNPVVLITAASSPHQGEISGRVQGEIRRLSQELGVTDAVYLLPELLGCPADRGTLRDLMLLSDLVFIPSVEEGFGMPLLEAATLRVPVLCSSIPPFTEVGGQDTHYFQLDDAPSAIAGQVVAIAASAENRQRRAAVRSVSEFRCRVNEMVQSGRTGIPASN